jgi:hypothetical protein
MNTFAYAQTYVVTDAVFFTPVLEWLNSSVASENNWKIDQPLNDGVAVAIHNSEVLKILILIHPTILNAAHVRNTLMKYTEGLSRVYVIAPGLIQYFASRINVNDPIFKAIDWLANYPVLVEGAPNFEMAEDSRAQGIKKFMHSIFLKSMPHNKNDVSTHYLTPKGQAKTFDDLVQSEGLANPDKIGSVAGQIAAEPINKNLSLVILTRAVFQTIYKRVHVIAFDRHKHATALGSRNRGYAKLAYGLLMLLFPSRTIQINRKTDGSPSEAEILCKKLNNLDLRLQEEDFTNDQLVEITKYNRGQWDYARSLLGRCGFTLPETPITREPTDSHFNKFTHIVISNFVTLQNRLGLQLPEIVYIAAPLLARNGMTFALGEVTENGAHRCGIIRFDHDDTSEAAEGFKFKDDPQFAIINKLLPQILSLEVDRKRDLKRLPGQIEQAS